MTEQQQDTKLAERKETAMTRVKNYMLSPEVKTRFTEMMGPNGIYYLNQVLILVANNDDLQKCTPQSILIAAMRAASLRLSVDPGQGQAWIIPYSGEATFQIGYKGVYELALRTNLYRFINVVEIYEGETLTQDRMTGIHSLSGNRTSKKIVAYMLYFKLLTGFEKTFVMTLEEIDTHAKHYSKAYNSPRSKWKDPYELPKMQKKTVLINGLRQYGRFNQDDLATLDAIDSDQGWMGAPLEAEVSAPEPIRYTEKQEKALDELGYGLPAKKFDAETGEILPPKSQAPIIEPDASMTPTEDVPVSNFFHTPITQITTKQLDWLMNENAQEKPAKGTVEDPATLKAIEALLIERAKK